MRPKYRIGLIGLLLLATGGLCVQYASADLYAYPSTDAIDSNPDADAGTQVFLFGEVRNINGDDLAVVGTLDGSPEREFTVTNVDSSVRDQIRIEGNAIQVYGTLSPESSTIAADRIVVDFRNTADRIYVYGTSLIGALLAITLFFGQWRITIRPFGFEPRRDR